jgi:ribonuclease HI
VGRGGFQEVDTIASARTIETDETISVTTDGGARPNPGKAGWGILLRQNKRFTCMWKHYPHASNNVMELSAVIIALSFLPPGMVVWISTYSQYV